MFKVRDTVDKRTNVHERELQIVSQKEERMDQWEERKKYGLEEKEKHSVDRQETGKSKRKDQQLRRVVSQKSLLFLPKISTYCIKRVI